MSNEAIRAAIGLTFALALASCGGGQRRPVVPEQIINRALAGSPGEAQPSDIVKAESAFARAAREEGQWTAFLAFAAPGALLHGRNGPLRAEPWLAAQDDPEKAVQWKPRTVWMSCDGALAVSQGRFVDPDGTVGTYVTAWERQPDRSYKWTYDVGAPDNPQPPPREEFEDGDIVVTSLDAVKGLVADCPRRGATTIPAPPAYTITDDQSQGSKMANDGTLRWRWEHAEPGQRRVIVEWLTGGKWETGLDETLPAPAQ